MAPTTDTALASALRLSVMRLARRMRAERADTTLSLSQLAALATVERLGPLTPGELAQQERVQPPSMTRIVQTLHDAGLVTRTPHPTDGRQALLEVTQQGRALLREDRRRREAWLAHRLDELGEGDRQALRAAVDVLDRLAGA